VTHTAPSREEEKRRAAHYALSLVQDGMILGLGSGSTAAYFVEFLGRALQEGVLQHVIGIPTSTQTEALARAWGIPLGSLDEYPELDLAVDGADEVDPQLNLLKGRGRALVREKIVAVHARHFVIIVDESKWVTRLGTTGPLPVEVLPFGAQATARWLRSLGCSGKFLYNEDGTLYISDNGHYLYFCTFDEGIEDPYGLATLLKQRPGVVDHGLFLDMAHTVIVGTATGVEVRERPR